MKIVNVNVYPKKSFLKNPKAMSTRRHMTFQNGGRLDTPKKRFFFFYHNFYLSNRLFSEIMYLSGENEVGDTFTD